MWITTFDQVLPTADEQRTAQWALRHGQRLSRISTGTLRHSNYVLPTTLGTTLSLLLRRSQTSSKKKSALTGRVLCTWWIASFPGSLFRILSRSFGEKSESLGRFGTWYGGTVVTAVPCKRPKRHNVMGVALSWYRWCSSFPWNPAAYGPCWSQEPSKMDQKPVSWDILQSKWNMWKDWAWRLWRAIFRAFPDWSQS